MLITGNKKIMWGRYLDEILHWSGVENGHSNTKIAEKKHPCNPAPAENLEASECKSSWKAKKLEVVTPAAAERLDQSRE